MMRAWRGNSSFEYSPVPSADIEDEYRRRITSTGTEIDPVMDKEQSEWITKTFTKYSCSKFVKVADVSPAETDPFCHCGTRMLKHSQLAIKQADNTGRGEWNCHTNCTQQPTDAFGRIKFPSSSNRDQRPDAPYVRLDMNAKGPDILTLFKKYWGLPPPTMMVIVLGNNSKPCVTRGRMRQIFEKGLMKIAAINGVWLFTYGMNAGVPVQVGNAIAQTVHNNNSGLVVVGFTSWGVIAGKSALIKKGGNYPCDYTYKESNVSIEPDRLHIPLEPNHTHFVLVDEGKSGAIGSKQVVWNGFMKALNDQGCFDVEGNSRSIPTICLLFSGDPNTLENVLEALKAKTALIVLEGSGDLADMLAWLLSRAGDLKADEKQDASGRKVVRYKLGGNLKATLRERVVGAWGEKCVDLNISRLFECILHQERITVVKKSEMNMDTVILKAMMKASCESKLDQVQICLDWDRVDIARDYIFTGEHKFEQKDLYPYLYQAINDDQSEFVDLLLDSGIDLKKFLTAKTLLDFYNTVPPTNVLKRFLDAQKHGRKRKTVLADIGKIVKYLMGNDINYHPIYLYDSRYAVTSFRIAPEEISDNIDDVRLDTIQPGLKRDGSTKVAGNGDSGDDHVDPPVSMDDQTFDDPNRELFLLSVLLGREEMSLYFWEEGKHSCAAALAAVRITRSIADSRYVTDLRVCTTLENFANTLEELAIGVVNECYCKDQFRTQILLIQELPLFGNSTVMELAQTGNCRNFISQSGCQAFLSSVWQGEVSSSRVGWLRFFGALFCPFLAPFLMSFYGDKKAKNIKDEEEVTGGGNITRMIVVMEDEEKRRLKQGNDLTPEQQKDVKDEIARKQSAELSYWQKVGAFTRSPLMIFTSHCVASLIFVTLFSYIVRMNFHRKITGWEIVLIFWVFTLVLEEVRQIKDSGIPTLRRKLISWIGSTWNKFDLVCICMFFPGVIVRFTVEEIYPAHVLYCLTVWGFYLRLMHIATISRILGPKVIMIEKMMKDLIFFIVIIFVYMCAYGVAVQSLMYPNEPRFYTAIFSVVYDSYFQVYGELFLEEFTASSEFDCIDNFAEAIAVDGQRCPKKSPWLLLFLALYMLLSNVLLLNLLIAMFSHTFDAVQENTDEYWFFQRYSIMEEYFSKPTLPPPFIIIAHILKLIGFTKKRELRLKSFPEEVTAIARFEDLCTSNFVSRHSKEEEFGIERRVVLMGSKLDKMNQDARTTDQNVQQTLSRISEGMECEFEARAEQDESVDNNFKSLHKSVEEMNERMTDILGKLGDKMSEELAAASETHKAVEDGKNYSKRSTAELYDTVADLSHNVYRQLATLESRIQDADLSQRQADDVIEDKMERTESRVGVVCDRIEALSRQVERQILRIETLGAAPEGESSAPGQEAPVRREVFYEVMERRQSETEAQVQELRRSLDEFQARTLDVLGKIMDKLS